LRLINQGKKSKAFEIGERHYDLGNDLFEAMLDRRMVYTCGYWKNAKNLDQAQEAKLDLVCRKISLRKGMKVLDIGGGWGGFAKYAAEKYGASVVNITVSKEQVAFGNKLCRGLSVENRLQDYRAINESFDRVVSLGMFEHVRHENYAKYMEVVKRSLKSDGLFLLHTIGGNITNSRGDIWTSKYIFPNSHLPSIKQIGDSTERKFVMEDWHNFGADYDKTLLVWNQNFEKAWPNLKKKYSETFRRMWRLYLLSSAGSFRARNIQLWQIVLSPTGVPGGYTPVR
jgi:cyclopropane-fatty-acyl-phospholipid synthase